MTCILNLARAYFFSNLKLSLIFLLISRAFYNGPHLYKSSFLFSELEKTAIMNVLPHLAILVNV